MGLAAGMWVGFGFESGGEIIFGLGKHTGVLWSVDDFLANAKLTRWCAFQQESATIGLGLGGSAGWNLVVGYNAAIPSDFEGASVGADFSVDLALGKLDKYFRNLPEMLELAAIARKFDPTWMSVANNMKKYENSKVLKPLTDHLVKNQSGVRDTLGGQTALLAFPLPGLGGGLRLSLKMKAEETTILSFDATEIAT